LPGVERLLKVAELAEADAAHFRAKAAEAYNPPKVNWRCVVRKSEAHFKSPTPQARFLGYRLGSLASLAR